MPGIEINLFGSWFYQDLVSDSWKWWLATRASKLILDLGGKVLLLVKKEMIVSWMLKAVSCMQKLWLIGRLPMRTMLHVRLPAWYSPYHHWIWQLVPYASEVPVRGGEQHLLGLRPWGKECSSHHFLIMEAPHREINGVCDKVILACRLSSCNVHLLSPLVLS